MNILLIVPRFHGNNNGQYPFPLGMAYISASLKRAGYCVYNINLNDYDIRDEIKIVERFIKMHGITLVGTGGLSIHYNTIKILIDRIKLIDETIITVLGGGIITAAPIDIYNLIKPAYGIVGEGENAIVRLVTALSDNLSVKDIHGLVYTDGDGEVIYIEKEKLKSTYKLPVPDYEGVGLYERWNKQLYKYPLSDLTLELACSRGCPYECTFCFHPVGEGYKVFDMKDVFEIIDEMKGRYDFNTLSIVDELFAPNKEKLRIFCERIKKYNIKWSVQLRANIVDEEMLVMMRNSGCKTISYGIESMSNIVLHSMKKNVTCDQIDNALKITYKNNIEIQGNLIFGDVSETYQTFLESMRWWLHNRMYQIFLSAVVVYPGSSIYEYGVSSGLINPDTFLRLGGGIYNITSMHPDTFTFMHLATRTISDSFLWYGHDGGNDNMSGDTKKVYICPKCGSRINLDMLSDSFKLLPNYGRRLYRITCHDCCCRFDVPLSTKAEATNIVNELKYLLRFADPKGDYYKSMLWLISYAHKANLKNYELMEIGDSMHRRGKYIEGYVFWSLYLRDHPLCEKSHLRVADLCDKLGYTEIANWHSDEADRISDSHSAIIDSAINK